MYAITSQAEIAEAITFGYEKILSARTLEYNGYIVVAVLTEPIFSIAERTDLKRSIKQDITSALNDIETTIVVSFDMELYRALSDVENHDKDKLIAMALSRS